jgi:hypothetical protein
MKFGKSLQSFTTYYFPVLCGNCQFTLRNISPFPPQENLEKPIIVVWPKFRYLIM